MRVSRCDPTRFDSLVRGGRLVFFNCVAAPPPSPLLNPISQPTAPSSALTSVAAPPDTPPPHSTSQSTHSALGFDYEKGRIDVSVHPFTGGSHPTDVRITTRYSQNWSESVSGTVHEVGGVWCRSWWLGNWGGGRKKGGRGEVGGVQSISNQSNRTQNP